MWENAFWKTHFGKRISENAFWKTHFGKRISQTRVSQTQKRRYD
jgi:hypothetical protein